VTTSRSAAMLDVQAPTYLARPPAMSSAGLEAVELAASAGLHLDPWQQQFLDAALAEDDRGRWAAFECALIVPRQNGKGSVLEARELAGLFLFDEQLILHSAHEFKTAQEAFRRVLTLVQSTPDLDRLVQRVRTSHGEEGIELRTGQRLRFVARSTGSGRGFTGDVVILDEAYNLPADAMASLLPTLSARPNPQLWYTSSAPLDRDDSEMLRRLCRRGRQQARGEVPATIAYAEFCADIEAADDDRAQWAQANPGVPHRISLDHIAKEHEALPLENFLRERLGVWNDDDDAEGVLPAERWAAALRSDVGIKGTPAFALDVSEDRKWSAFAAAGRSSADPAAVAIEVVDTLPGTAGVVARAKKPRDKWGGVLAVAKGSPAASLVLELLAAGVPVLEVPGEDVVKACGQLYDGVVAGRIHHRGQPVLDVAVRGAAHRDVGDAWVWSRRRSTVDISPLVAVTIAVGEAATPEPPPPRKWNVIVA
jgi:hypothetical protein